MARLGHTFANLVGKVEIFARGADELRRATEQALDARRPARALGLARRLKEQTPDAPLALALWADATAACGLDEEQCEALEALARQVPWRAELWLRLGALAARLGRPIAREALERAACAPGDPHRVRSALLTLCDLDLAAAEAARALRWLDRIPAAARSEAPSVDAELELRLGECAAALGRWERARQASERLGSAARHDGRDRLLRATVLERSDDPTRRAAAVDHAIAAFVVDLPGAERVLLRLVMRSSSLPADVAARLRERARSLMASARPESVDHWRAALLLGEGRPSEATAALRRGLAQGRSEPTAMLLSVATETEDTAALKAVAEQAPALLSDGHRALLEAVRHGATGRQDLVLDALGRAAAELPDWAGALADELLGAWLPDPASGAATEWTPLLRELRAAARAVEDAAALAAVDALGQEQGRPLEVALVGEFNAGKSTLVNAWLGAEVAPTGVLPTTQCVHRVAWAPEPFVRIVVQGQSDRIVGHAKLRATLASVERAGGELAEVLIYAPLEPLRRVEILDTPGLNAPDHRGRELTLTAVRDAHLVLWLLDATTPFKETERLAMAEIAAADVPIQIIVNKIDRLAPDEQSTVLRHVTASLAAANIQSYRAPVGLSATLALRARLGDESARDASQFDALSRLLEEQVFDRALLLRESALRRKASRLARRLLDAAQARARAAERARAEREALAQALGLVARRIEQDPGRGARRIVAQLRPAAAGLELDMRPVARLGRPHPSDDPEVRGYLVDRVQERLGPPLVGAIAAWIAELDPALDVVDSMLRPLLRPAVDAAMTGVVCALDSAPLDAAALTRVAEAAIRAAARELARQSVRSASAPESVDVAWRLERLARWLAR